MISGTITDLSGRTLSGQTPDRVLALGPPCRAVLDRPQLRARRARDAGAYPGDRQGRRHPRLRLSERRPAERVRPLRRAPGGDRGDARRIRRRRASSTSSAAAAARRRTTSAPSRRPSPGKAPRAVPDGRAADAPLRPRAVRAHAGHPLRQRRRAHQRHRLGEVPQADHQRRLTPRRSTSRAIRSRTARRSSTSTWTRACSTPRRRWSSSSTSSPPSPTSPACR